MLRLLPQGVEGPRISAVGARRRSGGPVDVARDAAIAVGGADVADISAEIGVAHCGAQDEGVRAQYGLQAGAGNAAVRELLAAEKPCLVTRLGDVELYAVSFYRRWRRGILKLPYPGSHAHGTAGSHPAGTRCCDF